MAACYVQEQNDLLMKYIPLVKRIAGRIECTDSAMDGEDLISIGVIGLMDALKRFDATKSVPFEAYATLRIRGTIIDALRKSGKVSRDRIKKLNQYYAAKDLLEQRLGRSPEENEILVELGITQREMSQIYETVHLLSNVSLESVMYGAEGCMDSANLPEENFIRKEMRESLIRCIDNLEEREKIILNLYYKEELTLKEIAYTLDISIPRVSQIHGKILMKLRSMM